MKFLVQGLIAVITIVVLVIVAASIIGPWIEDLDIDHEFQEGWILYLQAKYCEAIAPLSNATQRSTARSRIPRYPFELAVNYAMIREGELSCSPYQPDALDDMVLHYYDLAGNWAQEKQNFSRIPELLDSLCKRNVDHYRVLLASLKRRGRSEGNIEACLKVLPTPSPAGTHKATPSTTPTVLGTTPLPASTATSTQTPTSEPIPPPPPVLVAPIPDIQQGRLCKGLWFTWSGSGKRFQISIFYQGTDVVASGAIVQSMSWQLSQGVSNPGAYEWQVTSLDFEERPTSERRAFKCGD